MGRIKTYTVGVHDNTQKIVPPTRSLFTATYAPLPRHRLLIAPYTKLFLLSTADRGSCRAFAQKCSGLADTRRHEGPRGRNNHQSQGRNAEDKPASNRWDSFRPRELHRFCREFSGQSSIWLTIMFSAKGRRQVGLLMLLALARERGYV